MIDRGEIDPKTTFPGVGQPYRKVGDGGKGAGGGPRSSKRDTHNRPTASRLCGGSLMSSSLTISDAEAAKVGRAVLAALPVWAAEVRGSGRGVGAGGSAAWEDLGAVVPHGGQAGAGGTGADERRSGRGWRSSRRSGGRKLRRRRS